MLSSAKTFFPDTFESLKKWPVWLRAVLFMFVVSTSLILAKYSSSELLAFINTPLIVTPLYIAIIVILLASFVWFVSSVSKRTKHRRLIYQFCDAWLEYLPFMFRLVTKIQSHEMKNDGQIFEFLDGNKEALKSFHEWRAKLRELLFKVDESELLIADNQHWEKLKKESKVFKVQSYSTPFSFILDQTQPWLVAVTHQKEAWAALHISDEFIERLAFKHPKVERLWKRRQKRLDCVASDFEKELDRIVSDAEKNA